MAIQAGSVKEIGSNGKKADVTIRPKFETPPNPDFIPYGFQQYWFEVATQPQSLIVEVIMPIILNNRMNLAFIDWLINTQNPPSSEKQKLQDKRATLIKDLKKRIATAL